VRLVSIASPWFKDLELIPPEELGKPRVDAVITICGIFRDLFGTHIDLLSKAIELAAGATRNRPSTTTSVKTTWKRRIVW